jgi:alanine racemase
MDLATVDAGPELEAEVGEEILVFGRRKDSEIRVEELARAVGTIAYEILVGIGPRVPRVRLDT